jgi:hypothetical protein
MKSTQPEDALTRSIGLDIGGTLAKVVFLQPAFSVHGELSIHGITADNFTDLVLGKLGQVERQPQTARPARPTPPRAPKQQRVGRTTTAPECVT